MCCGLAGCWLFVAWFRVALVLPHVLLHSPSGLDWTYLWQRQQSNRESERIQNTPSLLPYAIGQRKSKFSPDAQSVKETLPLKERSSKVILQRIWIQEGVKNCNDFLQ